MGKQAQTNQQVSQEAGDQRVQDTKHMTIILKFVFTFVLKTTRCISRAGKKIQHDFNIALFHKNKQLEGTVI